MDIVLNRRSVRKFDLNKMIPHEDLVDLIKHFGSIIFRI